MTYRENCTLPDSLLEQIAEQGLDVLPELVRIVINTAIPSGRISWVRRLTSGQARVADTATVLALLWIR